MAVMKKTQDQVLEAYYNYLMATGTMKALQAYQKEYGKIDVTIINGNLYSPTEFTLGYIIKGFFREVIKEQGKKIDKDILMMCQSCINNWIMTGALALDISDRIEKASTPEK